MGIGSLIGWGLWSANALLGTPATSAYLADSELIMSYMLGNLFTLVGVMRHERSTYYD